MNKQSASKRENVEWEVREINADGDAVDVEHCVTRSEAVVLAKRWIGYGMLAVVVERHDWNKDRTDVLGSYEHVLALGDADALRAGAWIGGARS